MLAVQPGEDVADTLADGGATQEERAAADERNRQVRALLDESWPGLDARERLNAALGLSGSATNLADGRVEVVAEGAREACEQLLALLQGGTTPGRVEFVAERWGEPRGETGFVER